MQEIWKSIEGYEDKYKISNLGRVKSLQDKNGIKRELILKPRLSKNGYLYLNLWSNSIGKAKKIHRLVAEAFCEKGEKAECVNHINGVKTDNRACNLEWCTYSYNSKQAVEMGLLKPTKGILNGMYGKHGKEHPSSKRVAQYTLDGVLLGVWDSCVDAGVSIGKRASSIQRCASGKRKTAFGYKWEYV